MSRVVMVVLLLAVSGCSGNVIASARKKCWNDMQMAVSRKDSIDVLDRFAYESLAGGATRCSHLLDSLPRRKPMISVPPEETRPHE
jgi:hypothetical protein